MYIGMNDYSFYTPEICDGGFCPRNCSKCRKVELILELEREETEDEA